MTMAKAPFVPGFIRAAIAAHHVARRDQLQEIFEGFFGIAVLDDRLGEITAPTLVMWGRAGPARPPDHRPGCGPTASAAPAP
jgi:pimeloyl-ACP methyl ester carboxylesterase